MPKPPPRSVTAVVSSFANGLQPDAFSPLPAVAGAALIVLITVAVYLPALRGGFILDDDLLLTQNRLIKAPDGLYRIWLTTEPTDYWPVTNTSLWLEWRLWKLNPTGYHITNLVLHIVDSLLLWIVLKKLKIPGAFLAAFLFAIHPVNVESVAWIAQRKNLMALLFFLLSTLWYLKADVESPQTGNRQQPLTTGWYWLSLLTFVLAMLSKGSVAILPVVLLLIAWWQRGRITRADLLQTVPFFLAALVLTAVNLWFRAHGGELAVRDATLIDRLLGAGAVVWFYLYKALWPVNLVFVYPQWNVQAADLRWWLLPVATLCASAFLWRQRRSPWGRALLMAWIYYCVCLLPVMGFTDVGYMQYSLVADHYQHLALIGVVALAGAGWAQARRQSQRRGSIVAMSAAAAVIAMFSLLTWQQCKLYGNPTALYQATLQANPNCWMAYTNLGMIEAEAGHSDVAVAHYRRALELNPNDAEAHYNLAIELAGAGKLPDAFAYYQEALRLGPVTADLYNNFGIALVMCGQLDQAVRNFELAHQLEPDNLQASVNLASGYARLGRLPEAIAIAQQAQSLAEEEGDKALIQQIAEQLRQYKAQPSESGGPPNGPGGMARP